MYSDYSAPGRTGLSMCMKHCDEDSNCRQSDGYVCANPRGSPWYGAILDDNQGQSVCIAAVSSASVAPSDTGVCGAVLPALPEAGAVGGDGGEDASPTDSGSADSEVDGGVYADAAAAADSAAATDAAGEAAADDAD
jgi:hypothetical protein